MNTCQDKNGIEFGSHEGFYASLKTGGSLSACLRCKKVLMKPSNCEMTQEEIDVLIEFVIFQRDKPRKPIPKRGTNENRT